MSNVASGPEPTEHPSDQEWPPVSEAEETRSSSGPLSSRAPVQSHGHVRVRDHGLPPGPVGVYHHRIGPCLCRVGKVSHRVLCAGDRRGLDPIRGRLSGWSSGLRVLWHGSRDSKSTNQLRTRAWVPSGCGEEIANVVALLCLLLFLCALVARRAN